MTLLEKLQLAGLPVISVNDVTGSIIMGDMDENQLLAFTKILLEHFQPVEYAENVQHELDVQALRDDYVAAMDRFDLIVNRVTTTNANLISDGKFLAKAFTQILKLMRRGYNEEIPYTIQIESNKERLQDEL